MPDNSSKTIPIFEVVEVIDNKLSTPGTRPFQTRTGVRELPVQAIETSVDVLSKNMASFIDAVNDMISAGADVVGSYYIETVEVQCQVQVGGKIGFFGTGVDLQGGSTMKIVFKNKNSPNLGK